MTQKYKELIMKVAKIMVERITALCICLISVIGICLVWSGAALAGTYWVSPSGAATWPNCQSASPLTGTVACALSTANNNAIAGDTIYLRGGTYTHTSSSGCGNNYTCGIYPKNRGTAIAKITYAAYNGETPVITTDGTTPYAGGITIIQGASGTGTYIRVTGITFRNLPGWVTLYNYANYNEIDHNTFYSDTGEDFNAAAGLAIYSQCTGSSSWMCFSTHNWIHHNTFSKVHQSAGGEACHEGADMIRIGHGYSAVSDDANNVDRDDYNTVEDNTIAYAGHALMDTYGGKNVVKNNFMHNESWITDYSGGKCSFPPMPNGKYGHRGLQITDDYARPNQNVLVEGNRIGFGSANPNNPGDGNIVIAGSGVIARYNASFGGFQTGLITKYSGYSTRSTAALTNRGSGGCGPYNAHVYNNTMYYNGHTYPYMHTSQPGCSTCPGKLSGICIGSGALGVQVKNNIAYGNYSYTYQVANCSGGTGRDITVDSVDQCKNPANYPAAMAVSNNWETSSGDPQFTNPDVSNPTSPTLPDLTLQAASGAIDRGSYLTQAKGAGASSLTLIVDDAMYFQDGTWGSDLARGVTLFPDWIAIGKVWNVVRISSIDYSTNTITLASPMSWGDRAPIWLYKKSDGAIVLVGAAPDFGAHESSFGVETDKPSAPLNLRLK